MIKSVKWLLLAAFLLSGCSNSNFPKEYRLVVLFAVDQFPGELLQRIGHEFTGGLRWLLDNGIDYQNAHHEHGNTVTGTAHYVISSGRHPGPAAVLGNSWYVRELGRSVNCVEDSLAKPVGGNKKARSYRQTNSTSLGDWMKKSDPASKVFTVAGKDRAAVFMGGKNADLAIYYDYKGSFMTSDYYADELPSWLVEYNNELNFAVYRDSIWVHIANPGFYEKYGTADHHDGELDLFDNDTYSPTLPVSLNSRSEDETNEYIGATPWFDRTVIELAAKLVEEEQLGSDNSTDLLGVGISTADWIGHSHGPHSHEVLDYFLRLDRYLENFIQSIDDQVGLDNVLFVLTSDHGVGPLPEYLVTQGIDAGRLDRKDFKQRIKKVEKWSNGQIKFYGDGFYFLNEMSPKEEIGVLDKILQTFKGVYAIEKWMTKDEILSLEGNDPFSRRMRNMIHPEKSPDVIAVMKEYYSERFPLGATHGTPYDYDTHVPILFSHVGVKGKSVERAIATVDIAPTIAKLVGVDYPDEVDGQVLHEVIQ